jgi:hypothetical protein
MVSVGDPAPAEAAAANELIGREALALERFLADREKVVEWEGSAFLRSRALRLSPAALMKLERGIAELIDSLPTADTADAPADAVPVRFLALGFPQVKEDE